MRWHQLHALVSAQRGRLKVMMMSDTDPDDHDELSCDVTVYDHLHKRDRMLASVGCVMLESTGDCFRDACMFTAEFSCYVSKQ